MPVVAASTYGVTTIRGDEIMKTANILAYGVVGPIMAFAVGCAGDTSAGDPTDDAENVGQGEWEIALVGAPAVAGCNVTSLFNIAAPLNQNVGFVGVNASNLQAQDILMQLFTTDQR